MRALGAVSLRALVKLMKHTASSRSPEKGVGLDCLASSSSRSFAGRSFSVIGSAGSMLVGMVNLEFDSKLSRNRDRVTSVVTGYSTELGTLHWASCAGRIGRLLRRDGVRPPHQQQFEPALDWNHGGTGGLLCKPEPLEINKKLAGESPSMRPTMHHQPHGRYGYRIVRGTNMASKHDTHRGIRAGQS
jgi:hypothetical protein